MFLNNFRGAKKYTAILCLIALYSPWASAGISEDYILGWRAHTQKLNGADIPSDSSLLAGFFRGYTISTARATSKEGNACISDGSTYAQLLQIVSLWIEENPKKWNQDPYMLITEALRIAYPCS